MRLKASGMVVAVLGLLADLLFLVLRGLPSLPGGPTPALDWMVYLGGPACLLASGAAAWKWSGSAGASLWLGGAVCALGLGLRSGPYLGHYAAGMAVLVAPQLAAGALLLMHARRAEKGAA